MSFLAVAGVFGAGIALGLSALFQAQQDRTYGDDEAPMQDALARARNRYGIRRPGVARDGVERITPGVFVRVFAAASAMSTLYLLGFILDAWWHVSGHPVDAVWVVACVALGSYAVGSLNTMMVKLDINDTSIVFMSAITTQRVMRVDIVGCRWLSQNGGRWTGWYVEQLIYDKAGKYYRVPNVLKDRIPRGNWVRELPDLGDF